MLFLLAVLLLGLATFVVLGVEDTRFHRDWEPVRYESAPQVSMTWEDSLPGRTVLPWSEDKK